MEPEPAGNGGELTAGEGGSLAVELHRLSSSIDDLARIIRKLVVGFGLTFLAVALTGLVVLKISIVQHNGRSVLKDTNHLVVEIDKALDPAVQADQQKRTAALGQSIVDQIVAQLRAQLDRIESELRQVPKG